MDFKRANAAALDMLEHLEGSCERIEIAGSIRRRRAQVGDVELVLIPKTVEVVDDGVQLELGATAPPSRIEPAPLVDLRWLEQDGQLFPINSGTAGRRRGDHKRRPDGFNAEGRIWRFWLEDPGIVVECYVVTPERWGLGFVVRTGSADFSHGIATRWQRLEGGVGRMAGLEFHDANGVIVPTPEESDVFEAVKLQYLEPWERQYNVERRSQQ